LETEVVEGDALREFLGQVRPLDKVAASV
jgi:cell division protease FtsH